MKQIGLRNLTLLKFATPVTGKVSAGFQPSVQHYGVDIVAARDTPIKSIMDGVVISAEQSVNTG
jgi:murein DD-endopeptidase MepM/ murein hydrolase activator NlpD